MDGKFRSRYINAFLVKDVRRMVTRHAKRKVLLAELAEVNREQLEAKADILRKRLLPKARENQEVSVFVRCGGHRPTTMRTQLCNRCSSSSKYASGRAAPTDL